MLRRSPESALPFWLPEKSIERGENPHQDWRQTWIRKHCCNALTVADNADLGLKEHRSCYTAFCTDAFAGLIAGWECLSKETAFVQKAIRYAAALRQRQGHPLRDAVHHSNAWAVHLGAVR